MKRILASALALLQLAWSAGPGAVRALAQTVTQVQTVPVQVGVPTVGGALQGSAPGQFSAAPSQLQTLPQSLLAPAPTLTVNPATAAPAESPAAGRLAITAPRGLAGSRGAGTAAPAGPGRAADTITFSESGLAGSVRLSPGRAAEAEQGGAAEGRRLDGSRPGGSAEVPSEEARGSADAAFARLTGERLIQGSGDVSGPAAQAAPRTFEGSPRPAASIAPAKASARAARPEPASPAGGAPGSGGNAKAKAVAVAVAVAATALLAAAVPLLVPHAAIVGAIGSVALTLIGIPQIVRNFKTGREGVKDLAIASPLIWFAAASFLSIASIGRGSSLAWNAANVAGVVESAAVLAQINAYRRDKADLKATLATLAAVAAPLPLILTQALMPLTAWADLAFTAAMGLLWVLNWPQIRRNYQLYKAEGRAPTGIAPAYPALVAGGSLLHLFTALVGMDLRWALNAIIGIVTTVAVLAQIYAPKTANALIGPLVRLQDRVVASVSRLRGRQAPLAEAFNGVDLLRFEGREGRARLAEAVEKAKALPGRSVIFLEAPTAAGKSTLAKSLEAALGKRIRSLEVDRYFKPGAQVPRDAAGLRDFDRPDALYLERVAADVKTLLAGGRVELPIHDMAAESTRFDSGEFMTLGEDEVLVLDSIFASHRLLREAAKGRPSLNLYLDAPAVVRLVRRLARDKVSRGKPVVDNLKGWARILENERQHILPLRKHADVVLNLVSAEELKGLRAAYEKLLAEEDAATRAEAARLMSELIKASLEADGV